MKKLYRVLNGMKAAGVPKRFSVEERQKRAEMARNIQHLAVAGAKRKARERRERKAEFKNQIKAAAEAGVFVPVQEWE